MFRKYFLMAMIGVWAVADTDCPPCQRETPSAKWCMPKSCSKPPTCRGKFNPCNPKGCSEMNGGIYLSGDFLYWRVQNQGFSYAYEVTSATNNNIGKIIRINPDWDYAFRAGLGWNTGYDFWDVLLNYTWVRNHANSTKTSLIGFAHVFPLFDLTLGPQFRTVAASTRFVMNMGDLEIGRLVYLTKSIALRPHWGARGGTLYQKFKSHFSDRVTATESTSITFNGNNNYWGAGPRAGVHGEWHISRAFSLLGKAAGALLYGKTQTRSLSQPGSSGSLITLTRSRYTDHFYQLVPHLQLSLGFQLQTCFHCETMFCKISASAEANYWWDQFNLPIAFSGSIAPFPTVTNRPLTMEGLTVNCEFDF